MADAPATFVHLHLHSEYSVKDSLLHIKPLVAKVKGLGQPALALTDQSNMFALLKFYNAARSQGIKPLLGADLWVHHEGEVFSITLLCQNHSGYLNLSKLISQAYLTNQQVYQANQLPLVEQAWLAEHQAGLIVLLGLHSNIGQALARGNQALADQQQAWWQTHFADRVYLELVRTQRPGEEAFIQQVLPLAQAWQWPVVATNDVRFLAREDFDAHEIRCCIHSGYVIEDPNRPRTYSEEQYLKSADEMQALFADIPQAITNTWLIAQRCNLSLDLGTYYLPEFPIPPDMTLDEYFRHECHKGLDARLAFLFGDLAAEDFNAKQQEYRDRLDFELNTILQMGFPGYFLIVADFIQWAKNNQIPVGPGRGSGAGSLVAYALNITDLDPIQYDLLFERFLNPERVSMPDFDVDFCMERRDEVIDYVSRHYGRDHVSQIITYGTMAAKAVVRDVGRVLGHPYGMVDGVAKLIPNELGIKLKDALEKEEDLKQRYRDDEEVKMLLDYALKLEGTVRNVGKHAGGVVIGPKPLDYYCPLYSEADGRGVVTQLDKNDVETIGLVKFDFLGLRTLTIIDWALQAINAGKQPDDEGFVDINRIPLADPKVFELIKTGKTTGVFQLESAGMQDLIRRLRPDCFEDIIALVALFRPGPLESGMVDNFIARKHGKEAVSYPDAQYQHDSLKEILEPTYGIILYQEQVMQIAQVLSGYTLGGADMLRRAMGKKKPEEMAKERGKFEQGAIDNGVDGQLAMKIFDLVEKFAGYGFNKSHSAAYALVSYQSAWLKTHYPAHFMAAQISSDMDNTDKVVHMINECYAMNLTLLPPDINRCAIRFQAADPQTIIYGLGAIKGVGEAALDQVLADRQANGPFSDLFDFANRAGKKINRRVLEALIRAGAFDSLHTNRQAMLESVAMALTQADQFLTNAQSGQSDLFGELAADMAPPAQLAVVAEMPERQRLQGEKDTLGLYLTGHPIEAYRQELADYARLSLAQLTPNKYEKRWVAGLVVAIRTKNTRSGDKMAFITLDDRTARLEVVCRPAVFDAVRDWLRVDEVVLIKGAVSEDNFNGGIKLDAEQLVTLAEMRAQEARAIKLYCDIDQLAESKIAALQDGLLPYWATPEQQGLPLVLECYQQVDGARVSMQLKSQEMVRPEDGLLEVLHQQAWSLEVVKKRQ
ncbi:DNA polymerase III subunit alpha [Thiomicrospira cyclica]|uniref:DNA polymerase III subunit alpha n=1 Tax=Thiomicrospira cyclica (strain DSM 14477 / JCM 11371 / ALM1) TaxID=717773 RepID=F6DCQ9_THICA|nr:DNA polymerase III subunit alpha [Thiomicrospira cyclica]AEG31645.1 DNA polymerase III, alpha subunit [Thiomicrospira cyclica ALM1]